MELKDLQPGQVITVPGFILKYRWSDSFTWHTSETLSADYTLICPHALTFMIPEGFNAVAAEVASIDKSMSILSDQYFATIADLRQRKEQLLQITFDAAEGCVEEPSEVIPPAPLKDIDDDIPF